MLVYLLCKVYKNWSMIEEQTKNYYSGPVQGTTKTERCRIDIKSETAIMLVSDVFEIFQN